MTPFKVYLLFNLIPNIGNIFAILCIFSAIIAIVICSMIFHYWMMCDLDNDSMPKIIKALKIISVLFFASLFIKALIPSQKEMAFIYVAPKIASNQDIQRLPSDIVKLIEQYIKPEDKKDE